MKKKILLATMVAALAFTGFGNLGSSNGVFSAKVASAATVYEEVSEKADGSLLVEGDIAFETPGSNGVMLRGSIRLPDSYKNGQQYPVAILSHGILGDRNQQGMFTSLTDALQKKGFVTLRFDFNGYGDSDGTLVNNSIKSETEDLDAIIDYVKTLNYVDTDRINLVGYSMGGAVSSLSAGERDDIHSMALWSAAAALVDAAERGDFFGTIVDVNNLPEEFDILGGAFTFGKKWFEDAIGLDVYGIASGYKGPVLIVHGKNDQLVNVEDSKKYQKVYGKNSKLVLIDKGEHVYADKPLDKAIKKTVDFLTKENKVKKDKKSK